MPGEVRAGVRHDPGDFVGKPVETLVQAVGVVRHGARFNRAQPGIEPAYGFVDGVRSIAGKILGGFKPAAHPVDRRMQPIQRFAGQSFAVGRFAEIAIERLGADLERGQFLREGARGLVGPAGDLIGLIQAVRGRRFGLIETGRETSECRFKRLGRLRRDLPAGILETLHPKGERFGDRPRTLHRVACLARLVAIPLFRGIQPLVEGFQRGLDIFQRLYGGLFCCLDPVGQAVDHAAQLLVIAVISARTETGEGLKRVFPRRSVGIGDRIIVEDDAVEPFAQRHALAPGGRFGPGAGARINPLYAPRSPGRHTNHTPRQFEDRIQRLI